MRLSMQACACCSLVASLLVQAAALCNQLSRLMLTIALLPQRELSDTPAASALARLHASDSELPSDEHEDGSRAGRELTPGTDVVRKNRRTIRRPERAAA